MRPTIRETIRRDRYGIAIFIVIVLIGVFVVMLQSRDLRVSVVRFDETALSYSIFLDRLVDRGVEVAPVGSVSQPFFTQKGHVVRVGGEEIQIFQYDDPDALSADTALIASDGSSIGTVSLFWVDSPHFFTSGRLIVFYGGNDGALLDLLGSVIGDQIAGM